MDNQNYKNYNPYGLPVFFKPLFWSYRFDSLDPKKNKKTIIINSINYGNLKHWQWLNSCYGKEVIREIMAKVPATELKKRSARLAQLLFNIKLNYAPRGTQ